jgi:hypothetical protein
MTAWHVTPEDWEHHYRYDDWVLAYEEAFERTESEWGPWTIVEATDRRFTWVKIYETVITSLEERLGWPHMQLPSPSDVEEGEAEGAEEEDAESEEPATQDLEAGELDISSQADLADEEEE